MAAWRSMAEWRSMAFGADGDERDATRCSVQCPRSLYKAIRMIIQVDVLVITTDVHSVLCL